MIDLISRQAAMIAFAERVKRSNNSDFAPVPRWNDAVEMIENLPSADVPHWIPCNERLPEEDGLYLVTTSKGQVQMHVFNRNGNSEEYWMRCNKAWMPLPKPYKGGDTNG